jgi:hypothetical protein
MRARFALLAGTMTILMSLTPGVAGAHDTNTFEACAAFTAAARYCAKTITIVRGDTVWLRVKAKPPHGGLEVILQKQNPGRTQWRDEGPPLTLSDGGRAKTSWFAGSGSVDEDDPYHFRFKLEDHGGSGGSLSNTLSVWVFKP